MAKNDTERIFSESEKALIKAKEKAEKEAAEKKKLRELAEKMANLGGSDF